MMIKSLSDKELALKIGSVDLVGSKEKIIWSKGASGLRINPVKK